MRVESVGEGTAVSRIIRMVEDAEGKKAEIQTYADRFSAALVPVNITLALAVFFCTKDVNRALNMLVIDYSCGIRLSTAAALSAAISTAARNGVLIKGGGSLQTLTEADTLILDKTGTLTKGIFSVSAVHPEKLSPEGLLHLAAHVERYSTHPIAAALREAYPGEHDGCTVSDVQEVAGQGAKAVVNGHAVCVGNERMMEAVGATVGVCEKCQGHVGTVAHVAVDGSYAGHVVIADQVKADAAQAIADLKALGVARTVMLTGDHQQVAYEVARKVGVDEIHAELMPADKVAQVERLLRQQLAASTLAFVGDGINDAPVLARADVGIAMGAMGSDAAIEAADVVLMDDKPSKIATAIRIARHTIGIAHQNAWFAIAVKVAILALAACGWAGMPLAVFGDVGVMVLAVLNATRALQAK